MNKILVIGSGGAGKSTFAKQLGERLNIEVIHLDKLYWKPGWVESPKIEWAVTVEEILRREKWILDGNYSGTLERRLAACDAVVFLDLPVHVCVWRVCKRVWQYRNTTRPDMAEGCHERFSWQFLLWVWTYRRRSRPKIIRWLKQYEDSVQIICLRSPAEVNQYLQTA